MGLGWRRAFCTTIPRDQEKQNLSSPNPRMSLSPNITSTLTCRTTTPYPSSTPHVPPPQLQAESPKLQCKTTKNSPRFFHSSEPSSPLSPSTFSLLKSRVINSKAMNNHAETKFLESPRTIHRDITKINPSLMWKVYNDDEPLNTPQSGVRFHPIPESDEEHENVEFGGFFDNPASSNNVVEVNLLPEAAMISVGRSSETHALLMKVKTPSTFGKSRAPIDLVIVINVSVKMECENLHRLRNVVRVLLNLLSGDDRLSIVAFSTESKRLFPLRRMTNSGKRLARRVVEAVVGIDGGKSCSMEAVKKAVKILEDRRVRNPVTRILLLSDSEDASRFSSLEVPVHAIGLGHDGVCSHVESEEVLAKSIGNVLSVVVQDLSVQVGFVSGSAPAEIVAVYGTLKRDQVLESGLIRFGELYADEERGLLMEIKVPSSPSRSHRVLSVRCSYKDPSTQEVIDCREQTLLVPRPHAVRSNIPSVQRLRSLFITTRALAEARRLIDRNELGGAYSMLSSGRALLLGSGSSSSDEFVCSLEAELSELNKKLSQQRDISRLGSIVERDRLVYLVEKAEPLTPTSAWRVAEKLARLAVMKKSMNRVSDLHGFENARF